MKKNLFHMAIVVLLVIMLVLLFIGSKFESYCTQYNDEPGLLGYCCDFVDWDENGPDDPHSNKWSGTVMKRVDLPDGSTRCRLDDYFQLNYPFDGDRQNQSVLHYGRYPGNITDGGYA